MSKRSLSKQEALILITPVVDNEASKEEKDAFFEFIKHDDEVRRKYETACKIKELISDRCPKIKAPDSLFDNVQLLVTSQQLIRENDKTSDPIYDIPCPGSIQNDNKQIPISSGQEGSSMSGRLFFIAASIIIIIFSGGWFYYSSSQGPDNIGSYNIEEYVFQHFQKHSGNFVEPHFSTASISSAENVLAQNYNMPITVPNLNNADFKGIVYSEFVPGFKAPMLEYYLSSENQYIYIFAFKIDELEKFGKLVRNQEAIKECSQPQNFHVRSVNGKHVVSWKWGDVWYAAISNHPGETIASLVAYPGSE